MMKKYTTPGLGEEISIEGYTRATIVIKHENRVLSVLPKEQELIPEY